MKPEEFEKQLQSQPFRPVPPSWRSEILEGAAAARRSHAPKIPPAASTWLHQWLWPSPAAWAALAAAWAVILALDFASRASVSLPRIQNARASTDLVNAMAERRRELTELPGFSWPEPVSKIPHPRPRGDRPSDVRAG